MTLPADDSVILSAYIATVLSILFTVIVFLQLCNSTAFGAELEATKYRFLNFLISITMFIECMCAVLHFINTKNEFFVVAFVISRAFAIIILNFGGVLFLLATFDTLYQSLPSAPKKAPTKFRVIFKFFGILMPTLLISCCILAIKGVPFKSNV